MERTGTKEQTCNNCGDKPSDSAIFCRTCGIRLLSKEEEQRKRRKRAVEEYTGKYQRRKGELPSEEESKRVFREIYGMPEVTSGKMAGMLAEELGIEVKPSQLRKYSSEATRRKVPGYIGAACKEILAKRAVERVVAEQRGKERGRVKVRGKLQELFEKGVPYPYLAAKLGEKTGIKVNPAIIGHAARGTMKITGEQEEILERIIQEFEEGTRQYRV